MMYCIYGTRQLQNMNVPGLYVIITLDYDIQMGAIVYSIIFSVFNDSSYLT